MPYVVELVNKAVDTVCSGRPPSVADVFDGAE